jgi:hypothetical protein
MSSGAAQSKRIIALSGGIRAGGAACALPGVPDIVGDQEGAGFVDCHRDRPAARFAVRIEETRDDILGLGRSDARC